MLGAGARNPAGVMAAEGALGQRRGSGAKEAPEPVVELALPPDVADFCGLYYRHSMGLFLLFLVFTGWDWQSIILSVNCTWCKNIVTP